MKKVMSISKIDISQEIHCMMDSSQRSQQHLENSINLAVDYNHKVLNQVLQICRPLFERKVTVFEYLHFFSDGTFCYLSTCPEWHAFFLKNIVKCKLVKRHTEQVFMNKNRYSTWNMDILQADEDLVKFLNCRKEFGIYQDFTIYKHHDMSLECWNFATKMKDELSINFYINNLRDLEGFIIFFEEQAYDIISVLKSKRIKISSEKYFFINACGEDDVEKEKKRKFFEETKPTRFCLHTHKGLICLTKREIQCLSYKTKGKKSKEIARLLRKNNSSENISHRTVEIYFNNIKNKFKAQGISFSEALDIFLSSPYSNFPIGGW